MVDSMQVTTIIIKTHDALPYTTKPTDKITILTIL